MKSIEELTGVSQFPKHIDGIKFNKTGQLGIAASNLTGRTWDGLLAVFNDAQFAPNIPHIDYAALNETGCTDMQWIDENRIVTATDAGTVEVWQLKDAPVMENIVMLSEHDDVCSAVSVSSHSKQIISASWDNCIKLWDLEVDLSIHSIHIHTDKVLDVLWNPFVADVFASASEDGTVKIYDNRESEKPASMLSRSDTQHPICLDWVDENRLCVGYSTGDISFLDMRTPNKQTDQIHPHLKAVNNILYFDGYVASASDDMMVCIHQLSDLKLTYFDIRHSDYVMGLAYNERDGSLWSSAWDGCVLKHEFALNSDNKTQAR